MAAATDYSGYDGTISPALNEDAIEINQRMLDEANYDWKSVASKYPDLDPWQLIRDILKAPFIMPAGVDDPYPGAYVDYMGNSGLPSGIRPTASIGSSVNYGAHYDALCLAYPTMTKAQREALMNLDIISIRVFSGDTLNRLPIRIGDHTLSLVGIGVGLTAFGLRLGYDAVLWLQRLLMYRVDGRSELWPVVTRRFIRFLFPEYNSDSIEKQRIGWLSRLIDMPDIMQEASPTLKALIADFSSRLKLHARDSQSALVELKSLTQEIAIAEVDRGLAYRLEDRPDFGFTELELWGRTRMTPQELIDWFHSDEGQTALKDSQVECVEACLTKQWITTDLTDLQR